MITKDSGLYLTRILRDHGMCHGRGQDWARQSFAPPTASTTSAGTKNSPMQDPACDSRDQGQPSSSGIFFMAGDLLMVMVSCNT
jgi:hypothetical protein